MIVIVVGCGRVGSQLAYRMQQRGARVSVIDRFGSAFANLPADFEGLTIEGSALSEEILRRARIDQADALAAVTSKDSLNAVVGHIARSVFSVRRVVVRNYDPRSLKLYEAFGLEVVSSSIWGARRLEELILGEPATAVAAFGGGEVVVCAWPATKKWAGKTVNEVFAGTGAVAVAIVRSGKALAPSPDTVLSAEDTVHISGTPETLRGFTEHAKGG
jgi:trk system potassium uptake protein TrkA